MAWKADKKEALKKLIRDTIRAAGSLDPAEIPHHVREQLKAHGAGDADVDALIREVLASEKDGGAPNAS